MIPESAVSSPVADTATRRLPPAATVPATTSSPGSRVTGRDSPVIIDSSTSAVPSATTPSAGTRAPGRTRTTSPTRRSAVRTISVPPSVTRSASSGSSSASALSAPRACMIERISIQWPRLMTVTSVASSHQTSISKKPRVAAQEVTKATTIARLMSVIIPGWRSRISVRAPARKTRPPYRKTIVPRIGATHSDPGKAGAA